MTLYFSKIHSVLTLLMVCTVLYGQSATLSGKVMSDGQPVLFANVILQGTQIGASTDTTGAFVIDNIPEGSYNVIVSAVGYHKLRKAVALDRDTHRTLHFELDENTAQLSEVVVSGTMKEVSKLESAVPVEVYSAKFFKSNPSPSVFEAIQNVNGVRPQVNCNVCNTGDIHINGLEGPYTMV